jgi:hypothetical protein
MQAMSGGSDLTCFASYHWDDDPRRALLARMSAACERAGVRLQFEAFEVGLHIARRMETIEFDSFVFLCTPASWASAACQAELRTARNRHVPVVTVRLRGEVPSELRERVFLDLEGVSGRAKAALLRELAGTMARRAWLHRRLLALDAPADPAVPWKEAKQLVEEVDSAFLAESAGQLETHYRPDVHPSIRYWLALGLGKAGTAEAASILDRFGWETEPFPLLGIQEAQQMLGG